MTKQKIIENICYTELVYDRINKKMNIQFSKRQIEAYIFNTLKETDEFFFQKNGKNFYVTNTKNNIIITINSYTFRVITVNKIEKDRKKKEWHFKR
jgi:hypothetical protein